MIRIAAVVFIFLFFLTEVRAQDTLPRFTVIAKANNRNVISWTNTFPYVSQISIQRSADSVRNFKTILTVPDPTVPQNGFVDTRAAAGSNFYRIFIVLDEGKYQFSKSRRPAPDTALTSNDPVLKNDNQRVVLSDSLTNKEVNQLKEKLQPANPSATRAEKFFIIKKKNLIVNRISERELKKFRDSIVYVTRDTLVFEAVDTIIIKPYLPKEIYRASRYVYTERYGNVMVSLPEAGVKKYSLIFYEENSKSQLFEIKEVRSSSLVLDKTNFIHSGWFWFELYEEGKLKEKHKFFIPKDF